MKVDLVPASGDDLFFIATNMRERDMQEIFATRLSDNPGTLTDELLFLIERAPNMTVVARRGGIPVAVVGALEAWPGNWELWAFGTDDFDHVAFSLTKWVRRVLTPTLLHRGLRRCQCRSMTAHTKAHDWMRTLGGIGRETELRSWGKNGEDFILFEWLREDLQKVCKEAA